MLKRRVLAALLALVLAGVGGLLLLNYVKGADQRARAGLQTVRVLVVNSSVPEGTAAEAVSQQVALKTLPESAVAPGALSSLTQVTGRVTNTDLQPGEQLLAGRFVDPASLRKSGDVQLPKDSQQISVSFDAARAVGGYLRAGDRVSVYAADPKKKDKKALVMQHVLISKVVGGVAPPTEGAAAQGAPAAAPGGSVLLTFAVTTDEAERILSQSGPWLALEPSPSKTGLVRTGSTPQ
ncbi:MAG TPA: Flp pilus assembly protein CpaB [Propionibacteriaceae bacterium]|nr:Flp pilus assembly protein CpaB [Propionibacteriaceae bacterium]